MCVCFFLLLATTGTGADSSKLKCEFPLVLRRSFPPAIENTKIGSENKVHTAQNWNRQSLFFFFALFCALHFSYYLHMPFAGWFRDCCCTIICMLAFGRPFHRFSSSEKFLDVTSFIWRSVEVSCACVSQSGCVCLCPSHRDVAFFIVRNVFVGKIFIMMVENEKRAPSHSGSYTGCYLMFRIENTKRPNPALLRVCLCSYLRCLWTGFCCWFSFLYSTRRTSK